MRYTPNLQIPIPETTDEVVPLEDWFASVATALDTAVGPTVQAIPDLTAASGWELGRAAVYLTRGYVEVAIDVTRTGVDLTADGGANFSDALMFTSRQGDWWMPNQDVATYRLFHAARSGYDGYEARVYTNGQWHLTGASFPGQTIKTGNSVNIFTGWPLAPDAQPPTP